MEEVFKREENVLSNYPKEWAINYYNNKKDLKIIKKDNILNNDNVLGQYISSSNELVYVDEKAIYHELSHMAFNDRNKYNKLIDGFDNLYYENGLVLYSLKENEKYFMQTGITEGFAEYLARKNTDLEGQHINYYFVNFLISIFGEDILKYPLTNDPIGLLSDQRFDLINKFINNLDHVNASFSAILVSYQIENRNKKYRYDMKNIRKKYLEIYNGYIIETFDSLYNEYKKYSDRLISYEEFIMLLNDFNNYDLFNSFNNKKYNIKKYIKSYNKL